MVSSIGSWIQITAENWLVLHLTNSGLALGITNAFQFGPLVLFGLWGGTIVDRLNRRRVLIVTQSALALLATVVGLLVVTNFIRVWIIWLAALQLGLIICIDKPALLAFLKDLVGEADLPNAAALNNAVVSSGRMIGPVTGGLLIVVFGMSWSFFINAVSYCLVVVVLMTLNAARLHMTQPVGRKSGQVREGLSYIWHDRGLRLTVMVMSVVFVAAYNFQVIVPLIALRSLGGSSELYGLLMSLVGVGAVTGSLLIARWAKPEVMLIAVWCGLLSIVYLWLALPTGVYCVCFGLFFLGVCAGLFNVTVTSTLQLRARDEVRGRVMATYSIGVLGSGLVGAPLTGSLADAAGAASTFYIIAATCASIAAATVLVWSNYKYRALPNV
jgi:MFS family permease